MRSALLRLLVPAAIGCAVLAGCGSVPAPSPASSQAVITGTVAGCLKYEHAQVPRCIGDAVPPAHARAAQSCAAAVLRADYQIPAGLRRCLEMGTR